MATTDAFDPPSIGLVLGGGGIAGYAFHCGVLSALETLTDFDPRTAEIIVGTSAGSIAGAALRGGVPATAIRDRLLEGLDDPAEMERIRLLAGRSRQAIPRVWNGPGSPSLAMIELRKGTGLRLTRLAAGLLPRGRLPLDPVSGPLDTLFGPDWPDRTLWIPATDLATGRRVVFGRDRCPPVARAVEASAALPGFFAPATIDERTYIDGGIGSPFNVDLLEGYRGEGDRPLDLVIVAGPLSLDRLHRSNPVDVVARALPRRRLRREVERLRETGVEVLVLDPDRAAARAMGLNPMDYRGLGKIVSRAASTTMKRVTRANERIGGILHRARLLERPPAVPFPEG